MWGSGVGCHLISGVDLGFNIFSIMQRLFNSHFCFFGSKGKIKHHTSDFLECKMISNDYTFMECHK